MHGFVHDLPPGSQASWMRMKSSGVAQQEIFGLNFAVSDLDECIV